MKHSSQQPDFAFPNPSTYRYRASDGLALRGSSSAIKNEDLHDLHTISDGETSSLWSQGTNLVYSGRNKIDLKPQSPRIRELLKLAIHDFQGRLFFANTFPNQMDKASMLRQTLRGAAKVLHLNDIRTRLKNDADYCETLGSIVCLLSFSM